jgi:hypothetical protein
VNCSGGSDSGRGGRVGAEPHAAPCQTTENQVAKTPGTTNVAAVQAGTPAGLSSFANSYPIFMLQNTANGGFYTLRNGSATAALQSLRAISGSKDSLKSRPVGKPSPRKMPDAGVTHEMASTASTMAAAV